MNYTVNCCKMPEFSIITCTYNAEKTLGRTIGSVAEQTFRDFEHLIIDGASTDGTLEIARSSGNVSVVSEPDKGLYDAMNKGIAAAKGKYLIFLNAGDKFHSPRTLQEVASMVDGDVDIIYGQTAIVDNDGGFIRMRRLSAPERLDWKSFRRGMLVCHQAFWASAAIAKKTPYDLRYRYSADVDWCIRVMKESQVYLNTRATLIDYLDGGMTATNRRTSLKERFLTMGRHYGWCSTVLYHCFFVVRAIFKR